MALHVDGAITAPCCGDEDVGSPDTPAFVVGRQSAAKNERSTILHRRHGGAPGVLVLSDDYCAAVQHDQLQEDFSFKFGTALEEP
jgi:hypothetical protein